MLALLLVTVVLWEALAQGHHVQAQRSAAGRALCRQLRSLHLRLRSKLASKLW